MNDIARRVAALAETWNQVQTWRVGLEAELHPVIHDWANFVNEYADTLATKFGPGVNFDTGSSGLNPSHYPKWPGAHLGTQVVYDLDLDSSTLTHLSFSATWYEYGDDNYHHLILPVAFITDRAVFMKVQAELWDKQFVAGVEKYRVEQEAKDLKTYHELQAKLAQAGKKIGL